MAPANEPLPFLEASSAFGIDLYRTLGATSEGNVAIAPVSTSIALAMTWAGARGKTKEEMTQTLHLSESESEVAASTQDLMSALKAVNDKDTELRMSTGLFVERTYGLEPAFLELSRQQFGAPAELVDFKKAPDAALKTINSRVSKQTHQHIAQILPNGSVRDTTTFVLTNAVYFLGKWLLPFKPRMTVPRDFYVPGEAVQKVPTMSQTAKFRYTAADGVQVLEMPYKGKGNEVSLIIVLPDERNGLQKVEAGLTLGNVENWMASLEERRIELRLPRFELRSTTPLKAPLDTLGMKLAFDQGGADFRGVSAREGLCLQDVYHEVYVKVDEHGTEAAAATAVVGRLGGSHKFTDVIPFIVDHPFLFAIRHRASKTLLFLGRVVAPASA